MANNVILAPAAIVVAAVQHTLDNGFDFKDQGTMQALRDPQLNELRNAVDPTNPKNAGKLSVVQGATDQDIIHRIKLNYMQMQGNGTGRNTRVVDDTPVANPGTLEVNFDYNIRREFDVSFSTIELLKYSEEAKKYMASITPGATVGDIGNLNGLSMVGTRIMQAAEVELLNPFNDACLTDLISGVGKNQLTNSLTPKEIPILGPDMNYRPDFFYEEMRMYKKRMKIKGKPIIIGGTKFMALMVREKIMSPTSAIGVNFQEAYRQLEFVWYYDDLIDTKLGDGAFIMFDPGAACLVELNEHGPGKVVEAKRVARTDYTNGAINLTQLINETNFVVKTDMRMRENDNTPYPSFKVTTGLLGGVWKRPAQMKKTYAGAGVTGIVRFKLVDRPTV